MKLVENDFRDTPMPDEPIPVKATSASTRPFPKIINAAAFMAERLKEPPQVIAGALHLGCKLSLGGTSKGNKTWALIDLAYSAANGIRWMNRFDTTKTRTLFINFELQDWTIQKRLQAIADAKGVPLDLSNLDLLNLRGHAASYRLLFPRIEEQVKKDYGLLLLDPAYKMYPPLARENDAGDVAQLLNAIDAMTMTTGAAIAYSQHFSKGNQSGKESIDRVSGSGVWARDPDSIITFTSHEEPDAFTVDITLRAFKPVEAFVVRWQYPLFVVESSLDPANLKKVAGRKKERDPLTLLAAIANNDEQNPISISQWAELTGMPRTSLNEYLTGMRSQEWIKTIGEGSKAKQAITAKGKAKLNERPTDEN